MPRDISSCTSVRERNLTREWSDPTCRKLPWFFFSGRVHTTKSTFKIVSAYMQCIFLNCWTLLILQPARPLEKFPLLADPEQGKAVCSTQHGWFSLGECCIDREIRWHTSIVIWQVHVSASSDVRDTLREFWNCYYPDPTVVTILFWCKC
jgi:hypothetical protein